MPRNETYTPENTNSRRRVFSKYLLDSLGSLSSIKDAIRYGEDIHMLDRNGSNLLHIAAFNSPADVISFLVNEGLDINLVDFTGLTPLHYAFLRGSIEQVTALIGLGANIDVKDRKGRSLIFFAIFNNIQPTDLLKYLIYQYHMSVDETDCNGNTPLKIMLNNMRFDQALDLTEFMN